MATSKALPLPANPPKMPVARALWPWIERQSAIMGGQPASRWQPPLWGVGAPITGVDTKVGTSWAELFADHVVKRAHELKVTPHQALEIILNGMTYGEGGHVQGTGAD